MKKFLILICFCALAFSSKAQNIKLDSLVKQYFTQAQMDTMSQSFIKVQNYLIRYSWNIYHRWDKNQDTIANFKRDSIDIRPFLIQRKESKPTYIYDVYPGLVIVLDSKEAIRYRITQIYSEQ